MKRKFLPILIRIIGIPAGTIAILLALVATLSVPSVFANIFGEDQILFFISFIMFIVAAVVMVLSFWGGFMGVIGVIRNNNKMIFRSSAIILVPFIIFCLDKAGPEKIAISLWVISEGGLLISAFLSLRTGRSLNQ